MRPASPQQRPEPPSGAVWLHEIKHDGFRVIARKAGERVRLYSRPGNDLTYRFPLIVEAVANLRLQSCIIDGEAVACGDDGIALFDRIRYRHHDTDVFMWAFDLIELNGNDLRRDPLNVRKATLASVLARAAPGLRLNEHPEADEMVCADWAKGGAEAIEKTRREQPGLYFRVVASLMPKQFKVENESANMTDEQIMQQIRQLDAQVAAELGQASIDAVLGEMEPTDRGRQLRRLLLVRRQVA